MLSFRYLGVVGQMLLKAAMVLEGFRYDPTDAYRMACMMCRSGIEGGARAASPESSVWV